MIFAVGKIEVTEKLSSFKTRYKLFDNSKSLHISNSG